MNRARPGSPRQGNLFLPSGADVFSVPRSVPGEPSVPRPGGAKKPRMAGLGLLEKVGYGKAAGLGAGGLLTAMVAAGQLNQVDPMTGEPASTAQNVTGGLGSIAGGVVGGLLGGLGGPLAPVTIPLAAWAGSEMGGAAGRGTAGLVEGLMTPSELDQQIADSRKVNDIMRQERMLGIPVDEAEGMMNVRLQSQAAREADAIRGLDAQRNALLSAALSGSVGYGSRPDLGAVLQGVAPIMGGFG